MFKSGYFLCESGGSSHVSVLRFVSSLLRTIVITEITRNNLRCRNCIVKSNLKIDNYTDTNFRLIK